MIDIDDLLNAMNEIDCLPKQGQPILDDVKRNYKNKSGKSCTYRLKDDSGDIIGWFKNHATGEWSKYISKSNNQLSKQDREERRRKMESERRKRDRQLQQDRDNAKAKAQYIWSNATAGNHPYLDRKGIDCTGARVYKGALIVPAYKDREIVNVQMIGANGEKRFLKDGIISGCYGAVGKDKSRIYISEGFATARAIGNAVDPFVSVWAYVAGNLKETAKDIRSKNPDSEIIICADNDQWRFKPKCKPNDYDDRCNDISAWYEWRDNGLLENIGIIKASEAARSTNAKIIWPDFAFDDEGLENKFTDFDDYVRHFGKDKIISRLDMADFISSSSMGSELRAVLSCVVTNSESASLPTSFSKQSRQDENWQELIICDGKGNPVKTSLKNNILFFTHHPTYKGMFKYNEFNHQITVSRCPQWENEDEFHPHTLTDIDISQAAASLEDYGMSPDITRTHKAIQVAADNQKFHPAREYFDTLEWDGVERLDNLTTRYFGADRSDGDEYLAFIGKKWMCAAVKRIYKAGSGFHHILVIEGTQGAGKSSSLKKLATFGKEKHEAYFTDSVALSDIQNKDTIPKLQGSIIVELAELSGFSKKDDEEIKRWITLDHDLTRLPYERTPKRFDRQFVLAATTNNSDYLKDPTGNRRFWPFDAKNIDDEAIERDKEQLWAEAVHLYKNSFDIIPTEHERALAATVTAKRMQVDTWEDDVVKAIENMGFKAREGFKTHEVMNEMGLGLRDQDFRNSQRVSKIIQTLGYISIVKWFGGKSMRVWVDRDNIEPIEQEIEF